MVEAVALVITSIIGVSIATLRKVIDRLTARGNVIVAEWQLICQCPMIGTPLLRFSFHRSIHGTNQLLYFSIFGADNRIPLDSTRRFLLLQRRDVRLVSTD